MHLHRTEAHRIALILIITCEISWASTQCKTIVMDVYMKKCRLGARSKRGLEKFNLQKYDEKYGSKKSEEQPDHYFRTNDSTIYDVPQKRQLSPGLIALPIVAETINSTAKARAYNVSGSGYYDPSLSRPTFDRSGYYFSAPHPLGRSVTSFRTPDFNDDLDINDEELDALYNDIYERSSRALKKKA